MELKPSKEHPQTLSLVQEIPDTAFLILLSHLRESDKWALWQCSKYLSVLTDGYFIKVRSPFPDCNYEQEEPTSCAVISIPRLSSKYKNLKFELINPNLLAVIYPSGDMCVYSLESGKKTTHCHFGEPITQVFNAGGLLLQLESGDVVHYQIGKDNKKTIVNVNCELEQLIDVTHFQQQQYFITTQNDCYLFDVAKKSVEKKYHSEHPIANLAMNLKQRLMVTVEKDDCYIHRLIDTSTFELIRSLNAYNCDDVGLIDALSHFKINRAGNAIRFFKDTIIQQMSVYRSEDDNDQVVIPSNSDQKDVHLLHDGQLCFVNKQQDDQFTLTTARY